MEEVNKYSIVYHESTMTQKGLSFSEAQLENVKQFLLGKHCLIAISNGSLRSLLRAVLSQFGVQPGQVVTTKSFREASQLIEEKKPEVIFSEFEFDEHFGIELSILQKEFFPDLSQRIFLLFADSGAESSVAAAAEEEVDAYLLRPVSEVVVYEYIVKCVLQKMHPSDLTQTLGVVKKFIASKEFDRAQTTLAFSQMTLTPHPALHFYLGYLAQLAGKHREALRCFEEGLLINPKHFKCMYGKFMSLYYLGRKHEAYRFVTDLRKIYPLTPELLKYAFVVVVETHNFDEIDQYYHLYLKQVRKPESLKLIVSTALLTCGKVILRQDNKEIQRVLNLFVKGAVISGKQVDFIEGIIQELILHNMTDHLNRFFEMFKEGEISFKLIRSLRFKQWVKERRDPHFLINEGKRMIFEDHADEFVIQEVLKIAKEQDKGTLVQSLVVRLIENYPDRRQEYAGYLSD